MSPDWTAGSTAYSQTAITCRLTPQVTTATDWQVIQSVPVGTFNDLKVTIPVSDVVQWNQTVTTAQTQLQQLRAQVVAIQQQYQQYPPPLPPVQPVRPPAGFNRYVNASDLVEDFIAFAGAEGVRQGDVLGLPVELFVKWLVIRACEEEQADPGVTLELPRRAAQPRCLGCQRWMRRGVTVPLHDDRCAGLYFGRAA